MRPEQTTHRSCFQKTPSRKDAPNVLSERQWTLCCMAAKSRSNRTDHHPNGDHSLPFPTIPTGFHPMIDLPNPMENPVPTVFQTLWKTPFQRPSNPCSVIPPTPPQGWKRLWGRTTPLKMAPDTVARFADRREDPSQSNSWLGSFRSGQAAAF